MPDAAPPARIGKTPGMRLKPAVPVVVILGARKAARRKAAQDKRDTPPVARFRPGLINR